MGHTGRDDPDFPRRQTEFSAWTVEVRGSAGLEEQFRGSMKMGAWPALEIPTLRGNPDFQTFRPRATDGLLEDSGIKGWNG
jgi:hypothetical protein